jgi:hypothetical protein
MSLKTINITPEHFQVAGKRKKPDKVLTPKININSGNIRQILLDRLREQRKTLKKHQPKIQMNTFDDAFDLLPSTNVQSTSHTPDPVSQSQPIIQTSQHTITPDKPYGVLKHGKKPTYKVWNRTMKNPYPIQTTVPSQPIQQTKSSDTPDYSTTSERVSEPSQEKIVQNPCPPVETIHSPDSLIQQKEIKKTFKLGRNKPNKTVSVLIKSIHTRKNIEAEKDAAKRTNLNTVKNYLKKNNLIRHGTPAPSNLLRAIYENAKLCGTIINENPSTLVHNFDK